MIAAPCQPQPAILGANALRRRLAAAALDGGRRRATRCSCAPRGCGRCLFPPNSFDVSGKDEQQP
jgi:hypothetical protein